MYVNSVPWVRIPPRPLPSNDLRRVAGLRFPAQHSLCANFLCWGTREYGRPAAAGTTIVIQDGSYRDSDSGTRVFSDLAVDASEPRRDTRALRLYQQQPRLCEAAYQIAARFSAGLTI